MSITPQDVRDAFALPAGCAAARRLPKDILAEHGAANAADRKLIDKVIARLDWWATLSPATIGVAEGNTDSERPVPAIQLLAMNAREKPTQRLLRMVHRSIPVPVILLTTLPGDGGIRLSLAPLRRVERVGDKMVVECLVVSPILADEGEAATKAFIASLQLQQLPQASLAAVYAGLVERVEALEVAALTGAQFRLVGDPLTRRQTLTRFGEADAQWLAARAAAKKEKSLSQQVALGNRVRKLKEERDRILGELG